MDDWKQELKDLFAQREQRERQRQLNERVQSQEMAEATQWLEQVVIPAFEALKAELEVYGREIVIGKERESCVFSVRHQGEEEFIYRILVRAYPMAFAATYEVKAGSSEYQDSLCGSIRYSANELTKDTILNGVVKQYTLCMTSR
jgi:hypothetical protein